VKTFTGPWSVESVEDERETDLDYDFHEVFLGNRILTLNNLLKNGGKDVILVELQVDTIQLRESNKVCADQNTKVFALSLALLAIARVSLVLKSHPELVHFDKIGELKTD
jgi:hypothetical protein